MVQQLGAFLKWVSPPIVEEKEMKVTRVVFPALLSPETKMSRTEGDTKGDVALSVPTWVMTLLKVSMPAIVVAVGAYYPSVQSGEASRGREGNRYCDRSKVE